MSSDVEHVLPASFSVGSWVSRARCGPFTGRSAFLIAAPWASADAHVYRDLENKTGR
jgi:hypothetical protein